MWEIYSFIGAIVVLFVYDTYLDEKRSSNKKGEEEVDSMEENHIEDEVIKDNPRISPPVHSLLELMLKHPEGFKIEYADSECTRVSVSDKKVYSYGENIKLTAEIYYFVGLHKEITCWINSNLITEEEGEYLQEGIDCVENYKKSLEESLIRKEKCEVDRKIREVLEEVNL